MNDTPGRSIEAAEERRTSSGFWPWFNAIARPQLGMRAATFAAMFEHLDGLDGPIRIVETGCVRRIDDWQGDGCSTILFDRYARARPGTSVHSVNIDPVATALCRELVSDCVHVHTGDSVAFLTSLDLPPVGLLYLDSLETDPIASAHHHLRELYAALALIGPDTLVAVDDSPASAGRVTGKGRYVADYAETFGAQPVFAAYQIGWIRMHRRAEITAPPARIELNPRDAMLVAQELFKTGQLDEALSIYRSVADGEPDNFDAWQNVGLCLARLKRYAEALPEYDRAMRIAFTGMRMATLNRSQALGELARSDEAIGLLNGLLRSMPDDAHALYNRGVLLMQVERHEEAIADFERSLAIDPTCAAGDAVFCRGFANLVLGNYAEGFRDFEHRLKDNIAAAQCHGAEWTGEQDLAGRTILILSEMGHGDMIQFGRYLPMLVERGAAVQVMVHPGVRPLLDGRPGITTIDEDAALPITDYWCHMMSLAGAFRIARDAVPPPLPIDYDQALLRKWRGEIPASGRGARIELNVGLCWAGSPRSRYDEHRSIPLAALAPLIAFGAARGIAFHGFQQEIRDSDRDAFHRLHLRHAPHFPHVGPLLNDFRDTAHAMRCLDLMITVDTSVAHMAGTVGIPTWVLLTKFRTYWLWQRGLDTTPWYPAMRCIRQTTDGDWAPVIRTVIGRLAALLDENANVEAA
jgi:tetratricopeptide (TPR) repeat protein